MCSPLRMVVVNETPLGGMKRLHESNKYDYDKELLLHTHIGNMNLELHLVTMELST